MSDFASVLDATTPVTVEFLGRELTCYVYTASWQRLTTEQRKAIEPLLKVVTQNRERLAQIEAELGHEVPEERKQGLESEAAALNDASAFVMFSRAIIPAMVHGIDLDGESMTVRGKPFPDYIPDLPDVLVMEIANKIESANANPTDGDPLRDGSPQESETAPTVITID